MTMKSAHTAISPSERVSDICISWYYNQRKKGQLFDDPYRYRFSRPFITLKLGFNPRPYEKSALMAWKRGSFSLDWSVP